jgi:hypothetical protein
MSQKSARLVAKCSVSFWLVACSCQILYIVWGIFDAHHISGIGCTLIIKLLSWKLFFEANSHSHIQEIFCRLWHHVHKSPPPDTILSQVNQVHILTHFHLRSTVISSHLCLGLPSGLFPSDFQTKLLYAFLMSPMHIMCPLISSSLTWSA